MYRYQIVGCLLVGLLLLVGFRGPASFAEEDTRAVDRNGNVFRIYEIGSLVHGRPQFLEKPLGTDYGINAVDTEPRYPYEYEEQIFRYGTSEELIERLKFGIEPWFWEDTEGAEISTVGEDRLVICASPMIHQKIAEHLLALDYEPGISVELAAVPATPAELAAWPQALDAAATAAIVGRAEAIHARLLTVAETPSTVTRGYHEAIVRGLSGSVEDGVAWTTPRIAVARTGFVARVVCSRTANDKISVALDASLGDVQTKREGAGLELRRDRILRWQTSVPLERRTWRYAGAASVDNQAAWALFVRATVQSPPEPIGLAATYFEPPARFDERAPLESRRFDIMHLHDYRLPKCGNYGSLRASVAMWEPPELPEGGPAWDPDHLVELIQHMTGEAFWEQGSIQATHGDLVLRAQARVFPILEHLLDYAGTLARRRVVVDVRVYDAPRDPKIVSMSDRLAEAAQRGDATVVGFARVRTAPGQRNVGYGGTQVRYVGGYEIDAEEGKSVATPTVQEAFTGLMVDIDPAIDITGKRLLFDVRLFEQGLEDLRTRTTTHGDIELPSVSVFRTQTTVRATAGQAVIVSRVDQGTRTRIVTITPTIEPREREPREREPRERER